jgi:hypothetical protein
MTSSKRQINSTHPISGITLTQQPKMGPRPASPAPVVAQASSDRCCDSQKVRKASRLWVTLLLMIASAMPDLRWLASVVPGWAIASDAREL